MLSLDTTVGFGLKKGRADNETQRTPEETWRSSS